MLLLRKAALVLAQFPAECSGGVYRGVSQTGRSYGKGSGHLQLMGQQLAGPGWDQELRQPNPPTPTKEALGKHLETRNAATRAQKGPSSSSSSLGAHLAQSQGLCEHCTHHWQSCPAGQSSGGAHCPPSASCRLAAALGTVLVEEILPLVPELQEEVRRLRSGSDCERETPEITPCLL